MREVLTETQELTRMVGDALVCLKDDSTNKGGGEIGWSSPQDEFQAGEIGAESIRHAIYQSLVGWQLIEWRACRN